MANPRQRRKTRSSSYKPVSHSRTAKKNLKKTPPIRGPKALQDAWDKRKTVKQNYSRLGLVHDLNPVASGGGEKRLEPRYGKEDAEIAHGDVPAAEEFPTGEGSKSLPKGFGRIVRDEAGNVIGVELPEEEDREAIETDDETMESLEPEISEDVLSRWTCHNSEDVGQNAVGLVEELESIAAKKQLNSTTLSVPQSSTGPNHRRSAPGEVAYLQRLVDAYGDDVGRMARDRKLNADQRTEGQLRRALRNAGFVNC
ncbi:ribosome biogenesis protein Nop16 [Coprinopsis sp. MPI-PUGE-AT-0042]|nr:ribosome biogenesis protein Nop16 [Coprinopsis sp. MPI-PUGE-AT-0042]